MKKLVLILLVFCLLMAQANAESLPSNTQFYESSPYTLEVLTFTPLPDGAALLAGRMPHPGEHRDMPEHVNYESEAYEILVDAAAVCLEPDGTVRWTLRLADPQGDNSFRCLGLLPDGRLLISFGVNDSESFGSQHFIVGTDGIVEEMLPVRKIAEKMPPRALELMPGGYLWDASLPIDGIWGEAYPRATVIFDFDWNEIWRQEYSSLLWQPVPVIETPDGYLIGNSTFLDDRYSFMELSIQKLDRKGVSLWTYKEEPRRHGSISTLLAPPDGGVVFPFISEGENDTLIPTLKRLDENGNPLWAKTYGNITVIWGAAVLGDGFLLIGQTSQDNMVHEHLLLHLDGNGDVLAELPVTGIDGLLPVNPRFSVGPDGSVYLYSNLAEPDDIETRQSGAVKRFFYAKIDETTFQ